MNEYHRVEINKDWEGENWGREGEGGRDRVNSEGDNLKDGEPFGSIYDDILIKKKKNLKKYINKLIQLY